MRLENRNRQKEPVAFIVQGHHTVRSFARSNRFHSDSLLLRSISNRLHPLLPPLPFAPHRRPFPLSFLLALLLLPSRFFHLFSPLSFCSHPVPATFSSSFTPFPLFARNIPSTYVSLSLFFFFRFFGNSSLLSSKHVFLRLLRREGKVQHQKSIIERTMAKRAISTDPDASSHFSPLFLSDQIFSLSRDCISFRWMRKETTIKNKFLIKITITYSKGGCLLNVFELFLIGSREKLKGKSDRCWERGESNRRVIGFDAMEDQNSRAADPDHDLPGNFSPHVNDLEIRPGSEKTFNGKSSASLITWKQFPASASTSSNVKTFQVRSTPCSWRKHSSIYFPPAMLKNMENRSQFSTVHPLNV